MRVFALTKWACTVIVRKKYFPKKKTAPRSTPFPFFIYKYQKKDFFPIIFLFSWHRRDGQIEKQYSSEEWQINPCFTVRICSPPHLPRPPPSALPPRLGLFSDMFFFPLNPLEQRRTLAPSLDTTVLGLGAASLGDLFVKISNVQALATVDKAVEVGIK